MHVAVTDFDAASKPKTTKQARLRDSDAGSDEEMLNAPSSSAKEPAVSRTEVFNLAHESERTYARASNLLREALHAEGVVFVDATFISGQGDPASKRSNSEAYSSTNDELNNLLTSDGDASDSASVSTGSAKINGLSTRHGSSLTTPQALRQFRLPRRLLSHLIQRYPHGKVFNFEESGGVYASSGDGTSATSSEDSSSRKNRPVTQAQRDALRVRKFMANARTIAFYPLWDVRRQVQNQPPIISVSALLTLRRTQTVGSDHP